VLFLMENEWVEIYFIESEFEVIVGDKDESFRKKKIQFLGKREMKNDEEDEQCHLCII
jgi:hypothetical protein